jgi:hypothetical protein
LIQREIEAQLLTHEVERNKEELGRMRSALDDEKNQFDAFVAKYDISGSLSPAREASFLFKLMKRDYLEAISRLKAAETGMAEILKIEIEDPWEDIKNAELVDQVAASATLARDLQHALALATQFDQGFTVSVSLHSLIGEKWGAFLDGAEEIIPVDAAFFKAWRFPRLRGLSCMYLGDNQGSLGVMVHAPEFARRSDGKRIDQSSVPACFLGRVNHYSSPREPELGGALSLMNVCPIAEPGSSWRAQLNKKSPWLQDIELQISCIGQPKQWARDIWL